MRYQRITPQWLIKKLCNNIPKNSLVLEPSAGEGLICNHIINIKSEVHSFELNKEKRDKLKTNNITVIGANFLEHTPSDIYDYVVMCPPFMGNVDVIHVMHAFNYLKLGAEIRAIISPKFLTENNKHQIKFREFLMHKNYNLELLPDNTFIEKSKSVPTMYLKIIK